MRRAIFVFLLVANVTVAQQPLFRVVDLDVGATERVQVADGKSATVKLLSTSETRDRVRSAIRDARVDVEINGASATLSCGNYRLPVAVGGVQVDCEVTKAYYRDTNADHWSLVKDARLRLWPATSPYMPTSSFVYPVRQRWFATRTQMANEPTYVDGGESIGSRRVFGLLSGGARAWWMSSLRPAVSWWESEKAILDSEKDNASLRPQHNDTIWVLDERGWYHRYTHLYSFDPSVKLGGRVDMGQKIGTLGKEGGSGGWSHLHYEILSRQASGRLGTLEGYAFLWEAYLRQYKPHVLAVARPHQAALVGEKVLLDGSRSYSDSRIARFEWTFTDGGHASGQSVERTYSQPGTYSEPS